VTPGRAVNLAETTAGSSSITARPGTLSAYSAWDKSRERQVILSLN